MRAKLLNVSPILASLDLDRTTRFCEQKLGFRNTGRYDDYAIFKRDDISIHYWKCSDNYIAENTACYIAVAHIDALYAEYRAQGVIHPNGHLTTTDYGIREFAVLDDSGNLLRFGERIGNG